VLRCAVRMILVVRATVGDGVQGGGGAAGMVMVKLPREAPRVLWVLMALGRECS
jgi:hypothetical protein